MSTLCQIVWLKRTLLSVFPVVDYPLGGEQMTSSANAVRRSKADSQRDIPGQSNVQRECVLVSVCVCMDCFKALLDVGSVDS